MLDRSQGQESLLVAAAPVHIGEVLKTLFQLEMCRNITGVDWSQVRAQTFLSLFEMMIFNQCVCDRSIHGPKPLRG